jgi:hypothetical protein
MDSCQWHDLIGVTVDTAGSGHKAAGLESGLSQLTRFGRLHEELMRSIGVDGAHYNSRLAVWHCMPVEAKSEISTSCQNKIVKSTWWPTLNTVFPVC